MAKAQRPPGRFSSVVALLLLGPFLLAAGCGLGDRIRPGDHSDPPAQRGGAQAAANEPPGTLGVAYSQAVGGVAPVESSLTADYRSVWVGSYLDAGPAQRMVQDFQKLGLTAFSIRKTLVERGATRRTVIGDYNLVMTGLFGDYEDAEQLGRLLKAQGKTSNWQVVPTDRPAELSQIEVQTAPLVARSDEVVSRAQQRAGRPLTPDSPAVSGSGFKSLVKGRFIASFRDPLEAKKEAERLTAAGWPASVQTEPDGGGLWYRVWLAEPADARDFKAPPEVLREARASAMGQQGLVLLIDTSGIKGTWGSKTPNPKRTDASACAGYSQTGRVLANLERLIGYIPETSLLAVVKPVSYAKASNPLQWVTRPVKSWWTGDQSEKVDAKSVYGPSVYNRTEVLGRVHALSIQSKAAPIGPGLDSLTELEAIPGRKTVVFYSEFSDPGGEKDALAAMGRLKGRYGTGLVFLVVYGDTDDRGWRMADNLAREAGSSEAWDGCRLLADNDYFERYVKTVFRR
jgi:hypothetical protein